MTLTRLSPFRFAPVRTAHAWFDGDAAAGGGAGGGAAVADPPAPDDATPPAPPDELTPSERSKIGRLERELERMRKAEEDRKTAELSEVDRLKKQLADRDALLAQREADVKAQRLSGAAIAAATRLGYVDPELAERLLDQSRVEWGDDGSPKNVAALLAAELQARPYLRASYTQPPDLGQGDRGRPTRPLTRQDIEKMTPAEINARWDEVQEVMKKG